jgi:hypothetical protein
MNNSEYERKRRLLETWEERERDDFRKTVTHEVVSAVVDVTGLGNAIVNSLSNIKDAKDS